MAHFGEASGWLVRRPPLALHWGLLGAGDGRLASLSIDSIMDSFERGYNQISIQKYRETLVGMC